MIALISQHSREAGKMSRVFFTQTLHMLNCRDAQHHVMMKRLVMLLLLLLMMMMVDVMLLYRLRSLAMKVCYAAYSCHVNVVVFLNLFFDSLLCQQHFC